MSDPLAGFGLGRMPDEERDKLVADSFDFSKSFHKYKAWWPLSDGAQGPEADAARQKRIENASQVAIDYYDLVSPVYEQGWGQKLHYCPFSPRKSIKQCIDDYEVQIGEMMGLQSLPTRSKVLDMGCGVGGPARALARKFGCKVVGITNSQWHVDRATQVNREMGLADLVEVVQGEFDRIPFEDNTFDGAYDFEAICYAADLPAVYKELRRVCKPNAVFAIADWVMTDKYDPSDRKHRILHDSIERGNGVAKMPLVSEVRCDLQAVGWKIEHDEDMGLRSRPGPWYYPLLGMLRYATCVEDFLVTLMMERRVVVPLADAFNWLRIKLRMAPKELMAAFEIMKTCTGSVALGGQVGIFTPMHCFISRNGKER